MPVTTYLVAASLDGFIADEHDDLSWLLELDGEDENNPYPGFIEGVGALAMGATTYEWIRRHHPGEWVYEQPAWVFTHRDLEPLPGRDIRFTDAPVADVHAEMSRAAAGKDLWLVGGGELVGQFLDAGLLDELWVSVTPVTLGAGAPLLPRRSGLRLLDVVRSSDDTFVHLHYALR